MIRKRLFSAMIACCAAAGVATGPQASADPSLFSTLSCSCEAVPAGGLTVPDQINAGIWDGLVELQAISG